MNSSQPPYQRPDAPQAQGYAQPWTTQPAPAAPPAGPGRRRISPVLGALVGALVVVVIGAVLALTGVLHFGGNSSSSRPNTTSITLPASLGAYHDIVDATAQKSSSPTAADRTRARQERTAALTTERYSAAFGGAASAFRGYANADLDLFFGVIAVRADAPGLVSGPVVDPQDLGMVAGPQVTTITTTGGVQCLSFSSVSVTEGKTADPKDLITSMCLRTGDGVSVWVHGNFRGPEGAAAAADVTNAAFQAVSTG